MAAQELRVRPAGGSGASERLDRREAIFREREGGLLASHPGRIIIVCGGEVLASDTCDEALSWALAAHPGEPFLRMRDPAAGAGAATRETGSARIAAVRAFERDLARQKEIFGQRKDELLAGHPGMSIAVCGDEAFAGRDDDALSRAEAAHPDLAVYLCSYDPLYPCQCDQGAGVPGRGLRPPARLPAR